MHMHINLLIKPKFMQFNKKFSCSWQNESAVCIWSWHGNQPVSSDMKYHSTNQRLWFKLTDIILGLYFLHRSTWQKQWNVDMAFYVKKIYLYLKKMVCLRLTLATQISLRYNGIRPKKFYVFFFLVLRYCHFTEQSLVNWLNVRYFGEQWLNQFNSKSKSNHQPFIQ